MWLSSGCRFDKKPQYRYSGCHKYDVSALNIVLGRLASSVLCREMAVVSSLCLHSNHRLRRSFRSILSKLECRKLVVKKFLQFDKSHMM